MKTLYEYEPADIRFTDLPEGEKPDPVHTFLMAQMFIIGLTGFKPLPTDPPDTPMWPFQRLIADFLNAAQKAGITIAVGEAVPSVFREPSS